MRADCLRSLHPNWNWSMIDTDLVFQNTGRIWRSMAFRCKCGLAVDRINSFVSREIANTAFDIVWIDKGVFLRHDLLVSIRKKSNLVVHYTPDTAFCMNQSRYFRRSIGLYDLLVTTKSFEMESYRRLVDPNRVFLTTQAFDPSVHYPRMEETAKRRDVVFVGLAEASRERCISMLLKRGIPVRLAGWGWDRFVNHWKGKGPLVFEGRTVFGDRYAQLLSSSWIGLGLVSKRFPELHTTRTFEIPACGTILASERNSEVAGFFEPTEALLFDDYYEMMDRVEGLLSGSDITALTSMAQSGRKRVITDKRDYSSILSDILSYLNLSR